MPLYQENEYITIAIANYSYLGTIANPKIRLSQSGFECEFKSFDEGSQSQLSKHSSKVFSEELLSSQLRRQS